MCRIIRRDENRLSERECRKDLRPHVRHIGMRHLVVYAKPFHAVEYIGTCGCFEVGRTVLKRPEDLSSWFQVPGLEENGRNSISPCACILLLKSRELIDSVHGLSMCVGGYREPRKRWLSPTVLLSGA